jgi:hypothetical protein
MPASFINDPEHWHQRAKEARTLADLMNDEDSRQAMLRIAADYERLAERAAQRRAGVRQNPKRNGPTHRWALPKRKPRCCTAVGFLPLTLRGLYATVT